MTIIKLDAKAIEVLFPEGSEQRVELQKCVIAEFAKKAFSAKSSIPANEVHSIAREAISEHSQHLTSKINEAFKKVQVDQLKGLGYVSEIDHYPRGRWAGAVKEIKLTQSVVDQIRAEAQSVVQGTIRAEIQTAAKMALESYIKSSEGQRFVRSMVEKTVESDIVKQIQQVLAKKGDNNNG